MRRALYILADLRDEDLLWLNRAGRIVEVGPGETLIQSGRQVMDLFFVITGDFDVVGPTGLIAQLAQGDVTGEMSFLEGRLPSASVVARSRGQVLAISAEVVEAHLREDVAFAARFHRALAVFLSDRLRAAGSGAASGGVEDLEGRLLDSLHVAGDRFNRLMDLLAGRAR